MKSGRGLDTSSEALNRVFLMIFRGDSSLCVLDESLQRSLALLLLCSFCPFGRSKIADGTHISGTIAGNWEKFSTSNKRTSARPHWSRYRLCAKLRKGGQAESMDEMMLRSRAWLLLVIECEWEGSGETLFSPCTFYSRGGVSEMERKGNQLIRRS